MPVRCDKVLYKKYMLLLLLLFTFLVDPQELDGKEPETLPEVPGERSRQDGSVAL